MEFVLPLKPEVIAALPLEEKARIAAEWKDLGFPMMDEAEVAAMSDDDLRQYTTAMQVWHTWATGRQVRGADGLAVKKRIRVERDSDGRLLSAEVYG